MMSVIFEGEVELENSMSFYGSHGSRPHSLRPQEMTLDIIERKTVD